MVRHRRTVLDLFAGAGGMALGFEAAGARCLGAVEIDAGAAKTFTSMFAHDSPMIFGGPERGDMTRLAPGKLLDALGSSPEVVVGGPPCQGFSRVGRAKQMSLLDHSERVLHGGIRDPLRNSLYRYFLEVVAAARPKAFVMENVPGMREVLGIDMAQRIAREASHLGYNVRYFLLNAAWYGVPQQRWRIFVLGLRDDLGHKAIPVPPPRTHCFGPDLPEGVRVPDDRWAIWGSRIPEVKGALPATSVREAIDDLPRLVGHLDGRRPDGSRLPLRREPSRWVKGLREWPGRPAPSDVSGNWYRSTPRDYYLFREMAPGDRYPEALVIATRHFREHLIELRRKGTTLRPETKRIKDIRAKYIPPYRNDAFNDKWGKLIPDLPAWTVTAHLSRDAYSHIHYSSPQARTITVREAARLQSFPDAFEFEGGFGAQLSQIGNAVPPLLAKALACTLFKQLDALEKAQKRHS